MSNLSLTKSEIKTMEPLCDGKLYKEIADEHNITINTVKKHLKNAYRKLEVHNRTNACNKYLNRYLKIVA
ncbi:MAG: LuxR C-terminal-related transcriptional regulator [Ferruginibacter sp.]